MEPRQREPELVESLAAIVTAAGLDLADLTVALAVDDEDALVLPDRTRVLVSDGQNDATWVVPSLRALFRGDGRPPDLANPPGEYALFLYPIEQHVLTLAEATGHPASDDDLIEAFSALRRRPDGRSAGRVHDVMWQAVALSLGLRPTSAAEFEALMGRLEASARRFRQSAGSSGYTEFLVEFMAG